MKPLIFQFKETPELKNLDYSLIEYSKEKQLSVIKNTQIPAISYVSMDTETFTKSSGEPTDSDKNLSHSVRHLLDTRTDTLNHEEQSDSDNNYSSLRLLMDTQTITESEEPTDSDK